MIFALNHGAFSSDRSVLDDLWANNHSPRPTAPRENSDSSTGAAPKNGDAAVANRGVTIGILDVSPLRRIWLFSLTSDSVQFRTLRYRVSGENTPLCYGAMMDR